MTGDPLPAGRRLKVDDRENPIDRPPDVGENDPDFFKTGGAIDDVVDDDDRRVRDVALDHPRQTAGLAFLAHHEGVDRDAPRPAEELDGGEDRQRRHLKPADLKRSGRRVIRPEQFGDRRDRLGIERDPPQIQQPVLALPCGGDDRLIRGRHDGARAYPSGDKIPQLRCRPLPSHRDVDRHLSLLITSSQILPLDGGGFRLPQCADNGVVSTLVLT